MGTVGIKQLIKYLDKLPNGSARRDFMTELYITIGLDKCGGCKTHAARYLGYSYGGITKLVARIPNIKDKYVYNRGKRTPELSTPIKKDFL